MKKWFNLIAIFILTSGFSQNVSDYKYVYVPNKFSKFKKDNQYNLNQLLALKLEKKNYIVLKDVAENWPSELKQNPCRVLSADFRDNGNFLKNRAVLEFKDCKGNIVQSLQGESSYKEYDLGFQDSLERALMNVRASKASLLSNDSQLEENMSVEPQISAKETSSSVRDLYSNSNRDFKRIYISPQEFILVELNSSVPYATFRNSTKSGVFRVKLSDGTTTLGYTENNNLIIETESPDRTLKKVIFTTK